ncbi:MAG: rhomboid family intramembrane serine protease [Bacteroidota bacterium]
MPITITLVIVIITCLISYRAFNDPAMQAKLLHYPYQEAQYKEYYRLVTSGFIHKDWMHLIINMYVLYVFGEQVEREFIGEFGQGLGRINYLITYLLAIVIGDLPSYAKHKENRYYTALGASGAVSAVLFIYILFYPWAMLGLYFIIPCPAIVLGVLYVVYSSWASKNKNDLIGHDAHLYGAVFGFLFAIALKPSLFGQFMERLINDVPF